MKSKLLLPNRFKKIGWFLLIPGIILGCLLVYLQFDADWIWARVFAVAHDGKELNNQYFGFIYTNITNTVVGSLFIIGAMLVGFSKEKNEDEYIEKQRLSSLLWAVFVSYVLLLLAFLFVYGLPFLHVMVYNMFTTLIIFITRFNYLMYKNCKTTSNAK